MNGPKRMSPLYIVFSMLKMVRTFIPLIILFGVQIIAKGEFPPTIYWILGGALFLILLSGAAEIVGWRRFTYEEESDRITIRRGLIQRKEKIIYYSRIHSVSQEQPLIQRLLGVVQIKIETPGGSGEGDAVLPVLASREAERLQRLLNERSARGPEVGETGAAQQLSTVPSEYSAGEKLQSGESVGPAEPHASAKQALPAEGGTAAQASAAAERPPIREPELLYRLGPGRLLLAALTELNFGLAAAFVAGIFSFADDLLPDAWMNRLVTNAQVYLTGIKALLLIGAVALLAAWLLSLVLFIIKFAGFSLYREGERLSIRYGLLERKQFLFNPARVQAVTIREGWLRQALGYAHVEVNVVSSSSEKETPALHPFIPRSEIPNLLEHTIPQFVFTGVEFRPPRRALFAYVRVSLILTIILAAVLIYFFPQTGLWSLLLIPITVGLDYWSFRTSGAALENDRLTIVNRGIAKQTHCTLKRHIVALQAGGSRWQREGEMLNLRAHLMGGSGGSLIRISRLQKSDVERIYEWYRRERKDEDTAKLK
ncbi:PH domain-containing protein [Saccharibacillus kuerlensis]|uniref:UPF0699 transmembrane protein YdbT n=1 Tax=Saccharibacillus kuerlensis TaxID=459527 RepID=A0ABQ2L638_9BACL|nr:PH domain-containing protein [Saccharibacillus kuerlensis]GGO02092.1 UPF0699 transmembrane protein YdbT [Saccharibacillus kuerlensis]